MSRFKRILLVNPPETEQGGYTPSPLGLLYLAAYLRKNEPRVVTSVVDGAIESEEEVARRLKGFKPDLVGVSVLTPSRHQALKVARLVKEFNPDCKVVFGGIHPTLMWQQMMEHYPEIDYIVRGEGEITFCELVTGKNLEEIKGLVWKGEKNKVTINPDRPLISNLDSLPFPAWELVDLSKYPARGEGVVNGINLKDEVRFSIIFSRGCMAACTFCSSWRVWRGYRSRGGKNVADEVELLVQKYHAKHCGFYDDTLTGNRQEIINFCQEIIKRKIKIAMTGITRVDQVDSRMLRLMAKAGFYELCYGIESGSPAMLLKINKKADLSRSKKAILETKKAGIKSVALMMYGLPEETKRDKVLTEQLLKETKPDAVGTIGEIWIFPGTALYEQAKKARLLDDRFWIGKRPYYIYRGGIGSDPIHWRAVFWDTMRYYFADTFLNRARIRLLLTKELLTKKIIGLIRKIYHKIFLRVNFDLATRYLPVVDFIRQHYNLNELKVLEVSSSSEGLAAFLPVKITGVDVKFSGKIRPNLIPVTIKSLKLPFEDNSFDCVVCVDTLEHIPMRGKQGMIKEMIRVGRSAVLIVVPLGEKAAIQDEKLQDLFKKTWGREFEFFTEHIKYGLPSKLEIIKQIEVSLKSCQKKARIKYQPILNLRIHYLFMWAMIKARNKLTEFRAAVFSLLVPMRKLLNFGPCYRGFFMIELQ